MAIKTNFLITGASRGLGRALVATLLLRPNTCVVAATRNPTDSASQELLGLRKAQNTECVLVKIDSLSENDASDAAKLLVSENGLSRLDVVIANAGVSKCIATALETPIQEFQDHFATNTLGPLRLFQAMWPLLEEATNPKFIVISSIIGSTRDVPKYPLPCSAYGASKAALNYLVRKIRSENPGLVAFPIHPGWVQTDMGNAAAGRAGRKSAPVTLAQSVEGVLQEIDGAVKMEEKNFRSYEHEDIPW